MAKVDRQTIPNEQIELSHLTFVMERAIIRDATVRIDHEVESPQKIPGRAVTELGQPLSLVC